MLRMSYLLIVEAIIFATLTLVLFARSHDPSAVRLVAFLLGLITLFALVMLVGQKRLIKPFAKSVGICEMCRM